MMIFRRRKYFIRCSSCGAQLHNRYGWTPGRSVLCPACHSQTALAIANLLRRLLDADAQDSPR